MAPQQIALVQAAKICTNHANHVLHCGKVEFAKADNVYLGDLTYDVLGKHCDDLELLTDRETIKMMRNSEFCILFSHPEVIVQSKEGRSLLQTQIFQAKAMACVVDKAHCIDNW